MKMKKIITEIFKSSGFDENNLDSNLDVKLEKLSFFSKEMTKEYFLSIDIDKKEFKDYNNSIKDEVLSVFGKLKNSNKFIEKNTSLIISVKVNDFEKDYINLKNIILQIEEDEYYFRKYVIIYTDNSIKKYKVPVGINLLTYLNNEIDNIIKFKNFKDNNFKDELYFLIVQLFIKIPFLTLILENDENFKFITQIIDESIINYDSKISEIKSKKLMDYNKVILELSDDETFDENCLDLDKLLEKLN